MGRIHSGEFILESLADWDVWYSLLWATALKYDIAEYVDLTDSTGPLTPEKPMPPPVPRDFAKPVMLSYQCEQDTYRRELAQYNRQCEGLAAVVTQLYSTTQRTDLPTFTSVMDIKRLLTALKACLKQEEGVAQGEVSSTMSSPSLS